MPKNSFARPHSRRAYKRGIVSENNIHNEMINANFKRTKEGAPDSMRVGEIPYEEYAFVSDSQDVEPIKEQFRTAKDFDSFFVPESDLERGDISYVYGIEGIIPENDKIAFKVIS